MQPIPLLLSQLHASPVVHLPRRGSGVLKTRIQSTDGGRAGEQVQRKVVGTLHHLSAIPAAIYSIRTRVATCLVLHVSWTSSCGRLPRHEWRAGQPGALPWQPGRSLAFSLRTLTLSAL